MQLWFSTHTNIFFFVSNLDCRNKFLGWNLLSFIMSSCRWYFVVCKSCATSSHTTRAANFIALLNVKCNLFSLNNFAGLMFRPWKVKFHLQFISVIIGFDTINTYTYMYIYSAKFSCMLLWRSKYTLNSQHVIIYITLTNLTVNYLDNVSFAIHEICWCVFWHIWKKNKIYGC